MTVRPVTRHLWHVFDGERRLGAVRRVNGALTTWFVAQPEGAPPAAWSDVHATPDAAVATFAPPADAAPPAEEEAPKEAPDAYVSRFAALEID